MNDKWIDIIAFSEKYGISQSTIRRRIRAKSIEFKMQKGRYVLRDSKETLEKAPLFSRGKNPTQSNKADTPKRIQQNIQKVRSALAQNEDKSRQQIEAKNKEIARLLNENRSLKKELAEMETFCSALEKEIESLQKKNFNLDSNRPLRP